MNEQRKRQSPKAFEESMAFQASLKLGEEWQLVAREAPDLLVKTEKGEFGLEVSQCYIGRQGRKGSVARRDESANQDWLNGIRAEYERRAGVSLHLRFLGSRSEAVGQNLLQALLATDFSSRSSYGSLKVPFEGGKAWAFQTPNASWIVVNDRVGWVSNDGAVLQRVIDSKARKLAGYRQAIGDVRLLVVADGIYGSGKLQLEAGFRPHLRGFDAVYFFAYPRSVSPFFPQV
jgi:hypothetical protein